MFILSFSDWELLHKLVVQRELQLRQLMEADQQQQSTSPKHILREYKQVCETLRRLSEPHGRSWSRDFLAYKSEAAEATKSTVEAKAGELASTKLNPVQEAAAQFLSSS